MAGTSDPSSNPRKSGDPESPQQPMPLHQGHIVDSDNPAALAAVLGGYTNAVEQCAGVPPGAEQDADNTMEGIRHQDAALTRKIAGEQLQAEEAVPPGLSGQPASSTEA